VRGSRDLAMAQTQPSPEYTTMAGAWVPGGAGDWGDAKPMV
jgi:hypothetical protein